MTTHCLEDIKSPAKLNLFLHVTGQRTDGYHLLQSVFVTIDWYDILHFERRNDGKIIRYDLKDTSLPQDDLITRAAHLLQENTQSPFGANIFIRKNIPMQAGLGGGSSNAATTLMALNHLWETHLKTSTLATIAQNLGSDVPFFLHSKPAWVEGVGEDIHPITLPKNAFEATLAVLKPEQGVATQQIFSSNLLTRDAKPVKISDFLSLAESTDSLFSFGRNDLQPAAIAAEPQINEAIHWLKGQGASHVRMTGSGSTVFGIIDRPILSDNTLPVGWKLKVCKILDSDLNEQIQVK